MSLSFRIHCRVAPLIAKPGEYVVVGDEIAPLLKAPPGLLNITLAFHSEAEMQVWQDAAQSDPELVAALSA